MDFSIQENWCDARNFRGRRIHWNKVLSNSNHIVYQSIDEAKEMSIRMNDFPDEPLYTLIVNGAEIIHFSDWPDEWIREC